MRTGNVVVVVKAVVEEDQVDQAVADHKDAEQQADQVVAVTGQVDQVEEDN
jgi:hypothetical protein